jgi:hypothetical protein
MLEVTVAPSTNDLTTEETAVRELRLIQGDIDGLPELVTTASEICAQHCGRMDDGKRSEFGAQTVRQTERSVCRACIILVRDINPAIVSVVEDGTTLDADEYERDGSLLYRLSGDERVPWGASKVVITYTTGWTLLGGMPQPIERACLAVLAHLIEMRGQDTVIRREDNGLVSRSYSDLDGGVPQEAAMLLSAWRRITL